MYFSQNHFYRIRYRLNTLRWKRGWWSPRVSILEIIIHKKLGEHLKQSSKEYVAKKSFVKLRIKHFWWSVKVARLFGVFDECWRQEWLNMWIEGRFGKIPCTTATYLGLRDAYMGTCLGRTSAILLKDAQGLAWLC